MTFTPNLGRWLQVDPVGFDAGDMNLYRMEGNNPTDAVDPSGLASIKQLNLNMPGFTSAEQSREH